MALEFRAVTSWKELARLSIDERTLPEAFAAQGYVLPASSEVYLAEILPGVSEPAYRLFEAGQGAFSTEFWPASTVKLLVAVAAIDVVKDFGFTGDAEVTFADGYSSPLSEIYRQAVAASDNSSYDRLLQIAGLDSVNGLAAGYGLDSVVIGSSYAGLPVRNPPGYRLSHLGTTVSVPARTATGNYGSNDTDLFDLIEVLRRVALADEYPAEERFDLPPVDLERLREYLEVATPSFFQAGAASVLGEDVVIYHKAGWRVGSQCLDQALIVDPSTGRRFLLAATMPYEWDCASLSRLAAAALAAAVEPVTSTVPVQVDAGAAPQISLSRGKDEVVVEFDTEADTAWVSIDDGTMIRVTAIGEHSAATLHSPPAGEHVLRLLLVDEGRPVACRSYEFTI